MVQIAAIGANGSWQAMADAAVIGRLDTLIRPDQRCFLIFWNCRPDAYPPLVAAAAAELDRDLYTSVDEDDEQTLRDLGELGFTVARHEHHFRITTDPSRYGLTGAAPPPGIELISAADADQDRLRLLDDALRQDIPGADGWRWDPEGFHEQNSDPDFDPATYVVAVDSRTGEYIGLLRVWVKSTLSRLGCLGVLRPYRRTRVTTALAGRVAAVLHDRGVREVVTEISSDNRAALALVAKRGAVRTGGNYELVRHA